MKIWKLLVVAVVLFPALRPATAVEAELIEFDNGFQMVLMENHFVPMVASVVVVRTGVRNETAKINGVSHMLEHLLFNGTARRTQKELYDEIDFLGVYNNAFTRTDCTVYMILAQKACFRQSVDIQADMLLHSTIPADKIPKEKGIVINELKSDDMGMPMMGADPAPHLRALFEGSPYEMEVIGSQDSIEAITREQIVDYYRKWYQPSNMTALVMGDFERESVIALYRKHFGIQAPRVTAKPIGEAFRKPVVIVHPGKDEQCSIWVSVPTHHPRDPLFLATQVGVSVLESASSTVIDNALEAYGITESSVDLDFNTDYSWLTIKVEVDPAADHQRVVDVLIERLRRLSPADFPQIELDRVVMVEEAEEVFNLERLHYYGMLKSPLLAVAPFERFSSLVGDGYTRQLRALRPAEVAKALSDAFTDPIAVTSVFAPPKSLREAAAENLPEQVVPGSWESIDRPGRKVARYRLENGLVVVAEECAGSDVSATHILFKDRSYLEPEGRTGIADFLHHILPQGT